MASSDTSALPLARRENTPSEAFRDAVWGRVFNARRDGRLPRAVISATSAAHVRAALELAIRERCRVSVRSGGHSWAGWSVHKDAVLIDLGGLREVSYDEKTKIASCSPSTTGRMLNSFLGEKGRFFSGGHCPDVGLGGFLLQGGMGWNCKGWGWACESIVGIDVVTADAEETYCSQVENSDLFWAARGCGPGFPGIITRFHLQTRPQMKMRQSIYLYPSSVYCKVLQWVVDTCPEADPDIEIVAVGGYFPGSDEIQIMANFLAFKSNGVEALAVLQSIHDSRPPGANSEIFATETDIEAQYDSQVAANPLNHRYASDNAYIRNEADVPVVLEKAFMTLPNKKSISLYFSMNPCSRRTLPDMALSMQSDHYFALYTIWEDERDDERYAGWVKDVMKGVEQDSVGSYLGDSDFRVRQAPYWSREAGGRLREIRKKWDPEGRVCGYLDREDRSGIEGLRNMFDWE